MIKIFVAYHIIGELKIEDFGEFCPMEGKPREVICLKNSNFKALTF